MLPAISSDLPAYLLPPKAGGEGRQTQESTFGPAYRVELSADEAVTEASESPGNGLYGPNGQFVEAAVDTQSAQQSAGQSGPPVVDTEEVGAPSSQPQEVPSAALEADEVEPAGANVAGSRPASVEELSLNSGQSQMLSTSQVAEDRELSLSDFEAAMPPAARGELKELADNVGRLTESDRLGPRELKQIAELMSRVGRHDYAKRALDRAAELETSVMPQGEENPAVLQVAEGVASLAGLEE